ncbi:MAG TPA: ribbon-helix-helix domain-containing protein [Roseiflexaceae bacterium]|nr:ribbon-helix-helix domain-containing protein [Roseiflexaceae bacterium]
MAIKVRKQIYIEQDQNTLLKRLSNERGMPEAEIIREAITQHVQGLRVRRRDLKAWEAERDFIAQLIAQSSASGQRTWRREDLHDR